MNILAIDTSTDACSVAISIDGTITEEFVIAPQQHSKIILAMIEKLLAATNITLDNIDAFAFGRGPGSFTGLRIAASVIQALAFAKNKPVIPVSTLHAIAEAAYQETGQQTICATIDARMGETYYGIFTVKNSELMLEGEEHVGQLPEGNFYTASDYPRAKYIALVGAKNFSPLSAEKAIPVYVRNNVVT